MMIHLFIRKLTREKQKLSQFLEDIKIQIVVLIKLEIL